MATAASETPTNGEVYGGARSEFIALARGLSDQQAFLIVAQSPEWTVKDVLAHVVGINADLLSGNLEGIGSDTWTDAQVSSRAGLSVGQVADEWESLVVRSDEFMAAQPVMAMRGTADLVTHLHDVLTALGRRGDRDSAAVRLGLERYGPFFCERVSAAGLPVVRVEAGEQSWQSDEGEPVAVLSAPAFELLRAFSGRRSLDQIRAMDWIGDPEPYLGVVTPYGLPEFDVDE